MRETTLRDRKTATWVRKLFKVRGNLITIKREEVDMGRTDNMRTVDNKWAVNKMDT